MPLASPRAAPGKLSRFHPLNENGYPSTWAMLGIGFAAIGFVALARPVPDLQSRSADRGTVI
jgi:hypothetical protein